MKNALFIIFIIISSVFLSKKSFGYVNTISNAADTTGLNSRITTLLNDYSSNHDSLQKALNLSEQAENRIFIENSLRNIFDYYTANCKYDVAVQYFTLASGTYLSNNDSVNYAA